MSFAYGYVRVSSDKQADSGLGEEAQRQEILRYYESKLKPKGAEWGQFYEDPAVSAYKRNFVERPQARQLMRVLKPGDHLVISKSDRAFRNARDCLNTEAALSQMGITLHLLNIGFDTSTPVGKAMRTMLAVFDEMSSAMTGQRNEAVSAVLKSQGRRRGGPGKPYGYLLNPGGRMPPDVPERQLMEWMVSKHLIEGVYDREKIVEGIKNFVAMGMPVSREWTGNKVKAAIVAFWRIVDDEGVEWIVDPQVKRFALSRKGGK
jgi:DNA invertase Pin-like site-specific DNA recombinase